MKKTLVALAAVSAVAAFAQTTDGKPGIQIQGNFNGGYQANSYKGVRVSGFDQNGAGTSSIHFRGLEDLGGGNAAYFHFENDISLMNNDANQGVVPAYSANTGTTVTLGQSSTLVKTAEGKVGTFGNGEVNVGIRTGFGDLAIGANNNAALNYIVAVASPLQGTSFAGGYGTVLGADPTMTKVRWANSLRYITPTMNGLTGSFIYAAKQNSTTGSIGASGVAATTQSFGVGLNNQVGAQELGLKYANGPLTVGFATSKTSLDSFCAAPTSTTLTNAPAATGPCYTTGNLATGAAIMSGQDNKQTGLAASYALPNGLLLSGAYQKTTLGQVAGTTMGNQSDRVANYYQVQYTTGANIVFLNVGTVKENATGISSTYLGQSGKWFGAGYNYALSKNTAFVARWESFKDDSNVLGLTATKDYTQTTATTSGNNTRVRSQIGMIMNY